MCSGQTDADVDRVCPMHIEMQLAAKEDESATQLFADHNEFKGVGKD